MLIYKYYCERCDCYVERLENTDNSLLQCPTNRNKRVPCGLLKIMSKTSLRYEDPGSYKDDYQKKEETES